MSNQHTEESTTLFGNTYRAGNPSDEYYTPAHIFNTLKLQFDLDVCAPPGGVSWIPATNHYSIHDDGLTQSWHGRVWMNPPWSASGPWVKRWIAHGNGVALVPMSKSRWFDELWNNPLVALVVPNEASSIKFSRYGQPASVMMSIVIAAIGDDNIKACRRLGSVRHV